MPNVIEFEPRRNDDDYRREIEDLLRNNYGEFTFQKVDGSIRYMKCTLKPEVLPEQNNQVSQANPGLLVVWDTEMEGFRSVRYDTVIRYTNLGPTTTPKPQESSWTETN